MDANESNFENGRLELLIQKVDLENQRIVFSEYRLQLTEKLNRLS